MKYLFFLLSILFLIISCASTNTVRVYTTLPIVKTSARIIPVYIDKDFSSDNQDEIVKAIDQWNHVFNGQIELQVLSSSFNMEPSIINQVLTSHYGIIIMPVSETCTFIPGNDENPKNSERTIAWTTGVGGDEIYVLLDRMQEKEMLSGTILHELGHALGAPHNKGDTSSLMTPSYNGTAYSCIDAWSAHVVAVYQNLSMESVNYCHE